MRRRPQVAPGAELVLMLKVEYSKERWAETSNPHPDRVKVRKGSCNHPNSTYPCITQL